MTHHDDRATGSEELRRAPRVRHRDDCLPLRDLEVGARGRRTKRAGYDVALEPEGRGPKLGPVGQGLIDGIEVVERAAEPFDEEEHQGGREEREHDE